MEILAIYVEDFKCLKDFTIPFSPNYDIKIKKNKGNEYYYSIKSKPIIFNIFEKDFGKVTAFVGENGSGKSTIAQVLYTIASNIPIDGTTIIIYKDENGIKLNHHTGNSFNNLFPDRNKIKITSDNNSGIYDLDNNDKPLFLKMNTKVIFFSNGFHNTQFIKNEEDSTLIDTSVNYTFRETVQYHDIKELHTESDLDTEPVNITKKYYLNKLNRIINFYIFLNKEEQSDLKLNLSEVIKISEKVYINPQDLSYLYDKLNTYWANSIDKKSNFFKVVYKNYDDIILSIKRNYLIALLNKVNNIFHLEKTERREYVAFFENIQDDLDKIINNIHLVFEKNKLIKPIIEKYIELIKFIDKELFSFENILNIKLYTIELGDKTFPFISKLIELNKLLDLDIVTYNWANYLSSGEEAILNQLSGFYYRFNEYKKHHCIFVIDEGELYLHPKWQKSYLNILLVYLSNLLPEDTEKHLIVTSHSPFIISDIPKSDIIFLEKEKDECQIAEPEIENTFGANIYDLFAESFFMKDGFIGEFAMRKIKYVLDYVNSEVYNEEKHIQSEQICSIIADDIIKVKLEQLLYEVVIPENKKQNKLQQLLQEKEKIENEINKLKD